MVAKWVWHVAAVVACSSNSQPPDAVSSPACGGVASGACVCTGRAYDPCNDASGCPLVDNPVCEPYGGGKVCTVACTGSDFVCPLNGVGNVGMCENGFCFADRGGCTPR